MLWCKLNRHIWQWKQYVQYLESHFFTIFMVKCSFLQGSINRKFLVGHDDPPLYKCHAKTKPCHLHETVLFSFISLSPSLFFCRRNPGLNTSCSGFLQKLSVCLLSQSDLALGACQHGTQSSLARWLAQFHFNTALLFNTIKVLGSGWSKTVSCERDQSGELFWLAGFDFDQ